MNVQYISQKFPQISFVLLLHLTDMHPKIKSPWWLETWQGCLSHHQILIWICIQICIWIFFIKALLSGKMVTRNPQIFQWLQKPQTFAFVMFARGMQYANVKSISHETQFLMSSCWLVCFDIYSQYSLQHSITWECIFDMHKLSAFYNLSPVDLVDNIERD